MAGRMVCFIREVEGSVGHLVMCFTVVVVAKTGMFVPMNVSDVTEQGVEENVGILTR